MGHNDKAKRPAPPVAGFPGRFPLLAMYPLRYDPISRALSLGGIIDSSTGPKVSFVHAAALA